MNTESKPPQRYLEWLECFEYMKKHRFGLEHAEVLKKGSCIDSEATVGYLEQQLIKTINCVINNDFRRFSRELTLCLSYGEYDGIYIPFIALSKDLSACMFFLELDFMSVDFRRELRDSVKREAMTAWSRAVRQVETMCAESGDVTLEDQLFLIRHVKLFRDCETIIL